MFDLKDTAVFMYKAAIHRGYYTWRELQAADKMTSIK